MSPCDTSTSCTMSPTLVSCQKLCRVQLTVKAVADTHLVVDVLANVGQEAHEMPVLLAVQAALDLSILLLLLAQEAVLDLRVLVLLLAKDVLALAKDVLLNLSILVELALQECCSHAQLQA